MRFMFTITRLRTGFFQAEQIKPARSDGSRWLVGAPTLAPEGALNACEQSVREFASRNGRSIDKIEMDVDTVGIDGGIAYA